MVLVLVMGCLCEREYHKYNIKRRENIGTLDNGQAIIGGDKWTLGSIISHSHMYNGVITQLFEEE